MEAKEAVSEMSELVTAKICFNKYFINKTTMYILFALIILIFLIVVGLLIYYFPIKDTTVNNFRWNAPKELFPLLIAEFGSPDVISDVSGGYALWGSHDFLLNITLKDEVIQHNKPDQHCDSLYATINIVIPDDLLPKIFALGNNVSYDRQKKQLTVRCHFMGGIIGPMYLAAKITTDSTNADSYVSKYDETVLSTSDNVTYKKLYDELAALLKTNQTAPENIDNISNVNCKCAC